MSEEVCVAQSVEDLVAVADTLLRFAEGRKKFALIGDLGAGKTAFVKAFCQRQKVANNVSSPSFALVNEYTYYDENNQASAIYHLDLYRLKDLDEALGIGVEDYLDNDSYCFIEWPGIIEPLLPTDMVFVKIEVLPDGSRQFLMEKQPIPANQPYLVGK